MRKVLLVLALLFIGTVWFVSHAFRWNWVTNGRNVSIRVKENGRIYEIRALYARNKTYRIQRFIDEELHTHDVFANARMDGDIVLDDRSNFYVQAYPGKLIIRMDRRENDPAAYHRLKSLGEKLKHKLTEE
ncbi:MAG: hypothetical protein JWQ30_921 [Sediminibacterium sp.]|nr:hypothetical protein [Sediminibacterium sp.]